MARAPMDGNSRQLWLLAQQERSRIMSALETSLDQIAHMIAIYESRERNPSAQDLLTLARCLNEAAGHARVLEVFSKAVPLESD